MVCLLNNSSKMETDSEDNFAFAIYLRPSWNDILCIQALILLVTSSSYSVSSFGSYPSYYLLEIYNQFIWK